MKLIPPEICTNVSRLLLVWRQPIPDFDVHNSKNASALKKLLTADFEVRVYMEKQRGTT